MLTNKGTRQRIFFDGMGNRFRNHYGRGAGDEEADTFDAPGVELAILDVSVSFSSALLCCYVQVIGTTGLASPRPQLRSHPLALRHISPV